MDYPEDLQKPGVSRRDYLEKISRSEGFPFLDEIPELSLSTLTLLSREDMIRYRGLVFEETVEGIKIALDDPLDCETRDALKFLVKESHPGMVGFYIVSPETMDEALFKYLGINSVSDNEERPSAREIEPDLLRIMVIPSQAGELEDFLRGKGVVILPPPQGTFVRKRGFLDGSGKSQPLDETSLNALHVQGNLRNFRAWMLAWRGY